MRILRPGLGLRSLSKARGLIKTPYVGGGGGSELYTNEPGDYQTIATSDMYDLQRDIWTPTTEGYHRIVNATQNAITDPLGLHGQVLRYRWGSGHPCGSGSGTIYLSDNADYDWNTEMDEIYECTICSIYGNGSTMEDQPGQIKYLGYWGVGEASGAVGNHVYFIGTSSGTPSGGSRFSTEITVNIRHQEVASWSVGPNLGVTDHKMHVGEYHKMEFKMILNTPGSSNGYLGVWKDEVQIMEYTDRVYRTVSQPRPFFQRHMNGVYGGACDGTYGTSKTRADDLLIAHMHMSGKAA